MASLPPPLRKNQPSIRFSRISQPPITTLTHLGISKSRAYVFIHFKFFSTAINEFKLIEQSS